MTGRFGKCREREEEKRRLQAEMRRREQELLSKIKDQQRELESMKQEKGKVIFMILFLTLFFFYKLYLIEEFYLITINFPF